MANTIRIKRSTTAAATPTLDVGELGVNLTDRKLWAGGNGAGNIALGGDGLFLAYYGAGARLKLFDVNRLGARATLGLAYAAGGSTWDAFIEVVPVLDVIPDSDWTVTAFIGWRWFVELDQRSSPTPVF